MSAQEKKRCPPQWVVLLKELCLKRVCIVQPHVPVTSHNVIIVLTELPLSCAHVFFVDSRKVCNSFVPSCQQQHAHAHTSTQGHTRLLPLSLSLLFLSSPSSSLLSPTICNFMLNQFLLFSFGIFRGNIQTARSRPCPPVHWSLLPAHYRKVSIFVFAPHFCGIEGVNRRTTYSVSAWSPRPLGQYKFTLD